MLVINACWVIHGYKVGEGERGVKLERKFGGIWSLSAKMAAAGRWQTGRRKISPARHLSRQNGERESVVCDRERWVEERAGKGRRQGSYREGGVQRKLLLKSQEELTVDQSSA